MASNVFLSFLGLLGLAVCGSGFTLEEVKREDANKIVGGSEVIPNSWPFLVQISRGGNSDFQSTWCGGAVVSKDYILSAAHCFKGFESSIGDFRITAGEHDIRVSEGPEQRRKIAQIILHPDYNSNSEENDVALLKLESSLDLSKDGVKAIEVNDEDSCPADGKVCSVAGWGDLESQGDSPNKPHSVQVTVVSNEQCNSADVYGGQVYDSNVCAGEENGGKDSCQGDSGGPFVCKCSDDRRIHVGVVSWGRGCALAGYPGVYARTSSYASWIKTNIGSSGGGGSGGGGSGGGGSGGGGSGGGGSGDGGSGGGGSGGGGSGDGGSGGGGSGDGGSGDGGSGDGGSGGGSGGGEGGPTTPFIFHHYHPNPMFPH